MKRYIIAVLLLCLGFVSFSLTCVKPAQARVDMSDVPVSDGSDDPGRGRLAGDISPDFYAGGTGKTASVRGQANDYTGKTYTHSQVFDGLNIVDGIDVSQWQGDIDWAAVKADGIDYAFIRVGYRGSSDTGGLGEDTKFTANIQGATAAGLKVGVYIYSQAVTEDEASEEAQFILDRVGNYTIDMPLVLDYEYYSGPSGTSGRLYNAHLSKNEATAVCQAFCNTIKGAGYTPMVYANASMFTSSLNAADLASVCPLWLANYTTQTSYTGTYEFWQYASTGNVDGISGNVDMNFWYTSDINKYDSNIYVYTGQPITPPVNEVIDGVTLTRDVDYTVTYSNNVDVGTGTITIDYIGAYAGRPQKIITFQIVLPRTTGLRIESREKTDITLTWNPTAGAVGYNIFRSESSDGEFVQVGTAGYGETSYLDEGLTPATMYYYRIQPYVVNQSGAAVNGQESDSVSGYTRKAYTQKLQMKKTYSLRTAPGSSRKVKKVKKNKLVTVVCRCTTSEEDVWYYVWYKSGSKKYYGYMPEENGTLLRYGKTTKKNRSITKKAGRGRRVLTISRKKSKVTVYSTKKYKKKEYYRVGYKLWGHTYKGYIRSKWIKLY